MKKIVTKKSVNNSSVLYEARQDKKNKTEQMCRDYYEVKSIKSFNDIKNIDKWADYYLVGSDQMWNPWLLSPQYLLDFVPRKSKKPKLSYAASFGVDNIPDKKKTFYKKYLSEFSKITVREPRAAELVKEMSGKDAKVVLDPTFLLTQREWRAFSDLSNICTKYKLRQNYIVCYFIGSSEFNHIKAVKEIAEKIHLKIIMLPIKNTDYAINDDELTIVADACAYDFISLIDNAALVCTDSFHAVVFSFLMNTPFYDFPRFKKGDKYSQEARLNNIIEKFKLTDSYWKDSLTIADIENHLRCDYTSGYKVLEKERKQSLKILAEMLESK